MKLYLDTSIYGGYFDAEFELYTQILFEKIRGGEYSVIFSDMVEAELANSPDRVKDLVHTIEDATSDIVTVSDQVQHLAHLYLEENVVGKTSYFDCLHIALATLHNVDVLVSWNFKHIVNVNRIRGYNSVNYKQGHRILEIRSPREILDYE